MALFYERNALNALAQTHCPRRYNAVRCYSQPDDAIFARCNPALTRSHNCFSKRLPVVISDGISIHVVEESTVGGRFVHMMKKNFWHEYDGKKFFGFDLILVSLFAIGIVLFEILHGAWVI